MALVNLIKNYYKSLNKKGRRLFWLGVTGTAFFEGLAIANYYSGSKGYECLALMGALFAFPHTFFGCFFEECRNERAEIYRIANESGIKMPDYF